jgi:hypothetical protein
MRYVSEVFFNFFTKWKKTLKKNFPKKLPYMWKPGHVQNKDRDK